MSTYKVKFLGTKGYEGLESGWYGDCILIYNNNKMIVYDCGSEQHAYKVLEIMENDGINEIDIILSHNDRDHFNGIPALIESGKVRNVFTTLLLKYVDEILDRLDDNKRKREPTKERILKLYSNIAKLSGANLKDIYLDSDELPEGITFIGPNEDAMLDAVVTAIEEMDITVAEGSETLVNATSLQLGVNLENGKKLLLLADAAVENITCDLDAYDKIQLPHHGKLTSAETIFNRIDKNNLAYKEFIVSDNTGTSSGGSDALMASDAHRGKVIIKSTTTGTVELKQAVFSSRTIARDSNRGICGDV